MTFNIIIDFIGFILLIAVMITELIMLRKMSSERKERLRLEGSLVDTRRYLGRENYLSLIREYIEKAEKEVLFTSRSMTTPEKEPLMEGIIKASKEKHFVAKEKGKIYNHRGIIAPRHDTIAGAYQLIVKASIEIKFHDYFNSSTLRFIIVDKKQTILGIAKPEEKTELSYNIDSYTLSHALAVEFEKFWADNKALSFPEYLQQAIQALGDLPIIEKAKRLGIPQHVIEKPEDVIQFKGNGKVKEN